MLKKFQRSDEAKAAITKNFIAYWEVQRNRGKWGFAFRNGVLTWALPVFAMIEIVRIIGRENYDFEIGRMLVSVIVWSLAGFFGFGLAMWWWNERSYKEIKAKNPES